MKILISLIALLLSFASVAQQSWQLVDSLYAPLPNGTHVYFTEQTPDSLPFRAWYISIPLSEKSVDFDTDTASGRRLTPQSFYLRNGSPFVVVNGTFFSGQTNANLTAVVKNGKVIALSKRYSNLLNSGGSKVPIYTGTIGFTKKRHADVAWVYTDSAKGKILAVQQAMHPLDKHLDKSTVNEGLHSIGTFGLLNTLPRRKETKTFREWDVQTAIGGGPVLVQKGHVNISHKEERLFTGKAFEDRHPRTAMGYTYDGRLIILVVEGRNPTAAGVTLTGLAALMQSLNCEEALNLDGGGSTCMLINGKETVKPSDKEGQRPVPAVFMVTKK